MFTATALLTFQYHNKLQFPSCVYGLAGLHWIAYHALTFDLHAVHLPGQVYSWKLALVCIYFQCFSHFHVISPPDVSTLQTVSEQVLLLVLNMIVSVLHNKITIVQHYNLIWTLKSESDSDHPMWQEK